ncbi:MAG: DNA polymerase III subunit chi [Janthinobacterium lividum]
MTEINFYHLQQSPLEKTLPKLLEKIYSEKMKAVVLIENEEKLKEIDGQLWSYSQSSFLPHGCEKDGFKKDHPIWLTTQLENPNDASVLVVIEGEEIKDFTSFNKCLNLFNGYDEEAVRQARTRWQSYSNQGHTLTYWFQDPKGSWQKKDLGNHTSQH